VCAQAYGVCGSSAQGPAEVEGEPGVSISLVQLPGVELSLVHTLRSILPTEGEGCLGGGRGPSGECFNIKNPPCSRQQQQQQRTSS
jgi:hypothetical protein